MNSTSINANSISCFQRGCNCVFYCLSDLLDHFSSAHRMKSFHPIVCTYKTCKRSFTNRRYFTNHFNKTHGDDFCKESAIQESEAFINNNCTENLGTTLENGCSSQMDTSIPGKIVVSPVIADIICNAPQSGNGVVKEIIQDSVTDFCISLYSSLSLPFSHAEDIVKSTVNLVKGINSLYTEELAFLSVKDEKYTTQDTILQMEENFKWVESTFQNWNTKYMVKKTLQEQGVFIPPVVKDIGRITITKRTKVKDKFRRISVKGTYVFIPMRKVLTLLFQQEGVLEGVMKYLQKLDNDNVISNFVQSQCWINTRTSDEETGITLPLEIFNDDLEVGNPLGSHAGKNKVNATYFSIPCFVREVKSSLNYVFLAYLTHSFNLKYFNLKTVFKDLIAELNYLAETGITVTLENHNIRIFFQFCALCGDNLGLNTLGGFCQSFSKSEFCCRICLANRNTRRTMSKEDPTLLRTKENYRAGVNLQDPTKNGIKEECVFNSVKNFHIVDNCLVDVFHDIFEGVAQYDLYFLLQYYIFTAERFSVATFNHRLEVFDFGSSDIPNKPPPLPLDFKKKKKLRLSGCETACLLKFLGLLIGELVPPDDNVWELYLALRRIVDLALSPSFSTKSYELLALYVQEHNRLYVHLTKKALPFKFHNLVHYPRLIAKFGPLIHFSVEGYERGHGPVKCVSNSVTSRKNICLTIANKVMMKFGRNLLKNEYAKKRFLAGPNRNRTRKDYDTFFAELDKYIFTTSFPEILRERSTIRTNWVQLHGTKYCIGMTLYLAIDEETSFPIFGLIQNIFVSAAGKVYFLLKNFQTLAFSEKFYSFRLIIVDSYSVCSQDELHDFRPHNAAAPAMLPDSNLYYVSLLFNS